ncbi:sodium leak channel non-selective protein-like isoform X2 [Anneissia japonica]|uniref:sodium leak channel non-selective protein-like isoform X2 n=1 Tax=Anneissia japonica TaxID=1529436 RepID=UPI0014258D1F|nr:sodium leak channel non-selective protein-like isoform X2 [Anneissia japonica]
MGGKSRKQSSIRAEECPMTDFGADENANDVEWVNKEWVKKLFRIAAIVSFCSVSMNTPFTFEYRPVLEYVTLILDTMVMLLFTAEMIAKCRSRGLLKGDYPYLKNRWCIFDMTMVLLLWASVILQVLNWQKIVSDFVSVVRSPRPFIMIRAFRVYLKVNMSRARMAIIFKRSGQQVWSVAIFLIFFLALYGILGVQMFGKLSFHCVRKGANLSDLELSDFAIPDTYCRQENPDCPEEMDCKNVEKLPGKLKEFNGFDHIGKSVFTVYESASLEGWVYIMYKVIDSFAPWMGYLFFVTMVFFLSWLVKNVFIAVIVEVFAELRTQFHHNSGKEAVGAFGSQVLEAEPTELSPWKLVSVDEDKPQGLAPHFCQVILQSRSFHLAILLVVAVDAVFASTYNLFYTDDEAKKKRYDGLLYWLQVAFTVVFDLEMLFKIWCLGFKGYMKRAYHIVESVLAIFTTLHILSQGLYHTELTYFQVFRFIRLIKLSPTLEDFVHKVLGPGRKLGFLVAFTMTSLIIVSVVSLQLFCFIPDLEQFQNFFKALMSMFQILTQEGWVEVKNSCWYASGLHDQFPIALFFVVYHLFAGVAFMSMFQILTQKGWAVVMYETMYQTNDSFNHLIVLYFIIYHLFATMIVLSLFVAVILDNLELPEEMKRIKQLKATEQKTVAEKLPLRLQIFEKFPDKPQTVVMSRLPSDFTLPKIRESFIRQFIETGTEVERMLRGSEESNMAAISESIASNRLLNRSLAPIKGVTSLQKKIGVSTVVKDSMKQRGLNMDDGGHLTGGYTFSEFGSRDRRGFRGSLRGHRTMEGIRENGDSVANRNVSFDIRVIQERKQLAVQKRDAKEDELRENHPYFDMPLLTFDQESRIRQICMAIVYARYDPTMRELSKGIMKKSRYQSVHDFLGIVTYLSWCSILVTIGSCISMFWEHPDNRIMDNNSLKIMEFIFVIFMSFELLLKVLADGLFFTPKALIRDAGGALDVFIYFTSLIFLSWMPKKVKVNSLAQMFMILRCFRPLRIFTLVPHLRKVVYELLRGFKEIILVSILLLALLFMFASYGVQQFADSLGKCNDESITYKEDCHGEFLQTVGVVKFPVLEDNQTTFLVPRVWSNPRNFNFDNIGHAMLALFEVLSLEGWLEIRDIIEERKGIRYCIYIHVFVFIGCMIGLTLFVGVVIANFFENKGTALMTVDQRRWQDLKGRLKLAQPLHLPPRPDHSRIRSSLYDLTQNKYFKRFIACMVILNFGFLSVKWKDASGEEEKNVSYYLASCSVIFNIIFALEVILKCISLSPIGYWHSRRNRCDLIVTVCGVVWVVLLLNYKDQNTYTIGYVIIVFRFFTITGKHPTLKMLMMTIVVSMVKSFFIIAGLFLLMTAYAFAGVVLFGKVKYGESLSRQANFENATNATATLFRIVTGEDWNKIMHDCMVQPKECTPGENIWETDCGNPAASLFYFCTFYLIIAYIVLNLLVGIIMENFSLFYSSEEDALLSYADIKNFQTTWNMVDINRRGVIPVSRVKFVLRLLRGRLEVDMEKDHLNYKHMCCEIEKMRNGQDVNFHDVLSMLSYRTVDIRKSLQLDELMAREELEYNIEEEVAKDTIRNWLEKCIKKRKTKETSNKDPSITQHNFLASESKRYSIPTCITPNAVRTLESEEMPGLETSMQSADTASNQSSSPSHKLLVPCVSDGSIKLGEDESPNPVVGFRLRRQHHHRRMLVGSTPSTPASGPPSSTLSSPMFPKPVNSYVMGLATQDVQDWWREQLQYDSGSEED